MEYSFRTSIKCNKNKVYFNSFIDRYKRLGIKASKSKINVLCLRVQQLQNKIPQTYTTTDKNKV